MARSRRTFTLLACLGRGGFGEVYRARMRSGSGLETLVALKVLRPGADPASGAMRRLRDEGRLLARLAHPAIPRVLDLVRLDNALALVTELVEGQDLAELPGTLPPRPLTEAIGAVAGALAAAHGATADGTPLGLVHRDVKPTNVRIGRHGETKLLDFGIAWSRAPDREASTASDLIVGSLRHMAPERFLERRVRPAWDVFGLGTTLYEVAAGRRLLPDGMREASTLAVDAARYQGHLEERLVAAPETLRPLLRDLLAWEPSARPAASDVERRCEEVAERLPGPGLRPWARQREWPPPREIDGALVGRTLVEDPLPDPDDLATERARRGPAPPPAPARAPRTTAPEEAAPIVAPAAARTPWVPLLSAAFLVAAGLLTGLGAVVLLLLE